MSEKLDNVVLILSDARGIYIPRDFVCDIYNEVAWPHCQAWGIRPADAEILANPEHAHYWDVWDDVMGYARYQHADGRVFILYQDGDLWGLCYEGMTAEEKRNFGFEVEDDDDATTTTATDHTKE